MFCFIYKWMVSRSHDTGKPLSGAAARHINRCGECRVFAQSVESLGGGLRRDARVFLREDRAALEDKVLSALISEPKSTPVPRRRFMPLPAFAAAALVVLVSAAVFFRVIPLDAPAPQPLLSIDMPAVVDSTDVLKEIAGKVESPIETEMRSLEQSVKSAARTLLDGLDPKIKV